jgi:hypothetical protein
VLEVENGVLHHWQRDADANAAATVRLTRPFFQKRGTGQLWLGDLVSDELDIDGSRPALLSSSACSIRWIRTSRS